MGSPFGIVSLISGICGVAFPFLGFFVPFLGGLWIVALPIIAIIFGIIGIAKDDSKAPGIVGLIFGIIGLVIWVLAFVLLAAIFAAMMGAFT
ncbi:MAG: hypothetical protein ACFFCV_08980 [Promethearchaeota archaeon]